jgi:hypothetical protein
MYGASSDDRVCAGPVCVMIVCVQMMVAAYVCRLAAKNRIELLILHWTARPLVT